MNNISHTPQQNNYKTSKIVAFFAAINMLFSPYSFFGLPGVELLTVLNAILALAITQRYEMPLKYGTFMAYMLVVPFLATIPMGFSHGVMASLVPKSLILFSLGLLFIAPTLNPSVYLKYYGIFAKISVLFFFIQEAIYLGTGIHISLFIPYFDSVYHGLNNADFLIDTERSNSFFLEPSHFAAFIIPYTCIVANNYLDKKTHKWTLLMMLLGLLLSRSGCGFITILVVSIYLVYKIKRKVGLFVMLPLAAALIFLLFASSGIGSYVLARLDELSINQDVTYQSSGYVRIFRGYMPLQYVNPINIILGTGNGEINNYIENNTLMQLLYSQQSEFTYNGIQMLVMCGGVLGSLLFFRYCYYLFKNSCKESKIILLSMITMMFIEANYMSPRILLYLFCCYSLNKLNEDYLVTKDKRR